jgi:hypothetical protein
MAMREAEKENSSQKKEWPKMRWSSLRRWRRPKMEQAQKTNDRRRGHSSANSLNIKGKREFCIKQKSENDIKN